MTTVIIEINREPNVLGFGIDITQRKQAETQLLRTLAREKELSQLRSHFVSMVSHEFRTPLGVIQSSAEILEDEILALKRPRLKSSEKESRFRLIARRVFLPLTGTTTESPSQTGSPVSSETH